MSCWRQAGLAAVLSGALLGSVAHAQPAPSSSSTSSQAGRTQGARTLTFDVSPDHAAVDPSGPRVLKYLVDFTNLETGKIKTVDLGKPEAPDGTISMPIAQAQLSDGQYVASVRVVGQTITMTSATVGPIQIGKPKRAKSSDERTPPPAAATPSEPPPQTTPAPSSPADAARRSFWKRMYGLIVG